MVDWSDQTRDQDFERLASQEWDLLVVGGGITGCGIALDAASRGIKVALLEQYDFSSGTSSRSSKLIHGGLRYLKQGQLWTTLESSREKALLRKLAPHLVRDLPFLFPISGGWKQRTIVGLGLWIYDLMARRPRGLLHQHLSTQETEKMIPGLSEKYDGSLLYFDAETDDARLTVHVAKRAVMEGALLLNYAKVEKFLLNGDSAPGSAISGAMVRDTISGKEYTLRAKLAINATGVWCDETRERAHVSEDKLVQASKGAHILIPYERLPISGAAALGKPGSNRLLFLIPWEGRTLIGTTDDFYDGPLNNPQADEIETASLLEQVNSALPQIKLTKADVVGSFAGLRPLAKSEHQDSSKVSREERIHEDETGLITILGGKLTTYRQMAENVVNLVAKKLGRSFPRCRTKSISLFASPVSKDPIQSSFGSEAMRVQRIADECPRWRQPMVPGQSPIYAAAIYALRYERAVKLSDLLLRRTRLGVLDWKGTQVFALQIANTLAEEARWNPEREVAGLLEEQP